MSAHLPQLMPYPDVNTAVHELLASVQAILGEHLIGMYLYGSLALGDFDPRRSDLDFVIVTDDELTPEQFAALHAMHERFNASASPWATEVEASYIPQAALCRYDPATSSHPRIQRGNEQLRMEQHDVIQRHVLREHGLALVGPDPHLLLDPVDPNDLRQTVAKIVHAWGAEMLQDSSGLNRRGEQAYTVLTMCRILYTIEHGTIVSKPVAARWVLATQGGRWAGIIERALAWLKTDPTPVAPEEVKAALDLIQYTLERSEVGFD